MGSSGTESCERCPQTQFNHLLPQLALKLSLLRLRACSQEPGTVNCPGMIAQGKRYLAFT